MTSDLSLLRRYHERGDAFAFRELMQAHAGMVFATARRITRDPALAEDVAQETFLELARHAPSVCESVGAWLHRVAWRRACNAVRDASTRRRLEAAAAPDTASADRPETTWEELEPLIDEALDALPEKLRGPLVEHFLGGRTQQDIAARLGCSQATVSRHLDTGIDRVRAYLRQRGVAVGGALALLLAANAVEPAPASLVASLGKLAVSGVGGGGGSITATRAETPVRAVSRMAWWRRRGWLTAGAAAVVALLAVWIFLRPSAASDPSQLVVNPATAGQPEVWQGRAFCPDCAPPRIGGRVPAHGIFVHVENGRDVIYDLTLPQPLPDFHTRLCLPSMSDPHAVHVRGTVGTREGRLALAVITLEPRVR